MYTEIPLTSLEGGGVPVDTSVTGLRERVNDLLRDEREATIARATIRSANDSLEGSDVASGCDN